MSGTHFGHIDARKSFSVPDTFFQAALDDALEKVMAKARAEARPEVPLKRQWDAKLEAEMKAALTGFDPKTFDVARERPKTTDRTQGAGRDRGQEARKGRASARSSASAARACSSIWAEKATA